MSCAETITLRELANRMAERQADVTRALMKMGVMATASQTIDADTAELIVEEFGHRIVRVAKADVETALLATPEDSSEDLKPRPPVITIMGHVDHGKNRARPFRKSDVVAGAGGITLTLALTRSLRRAGSSAFSIRLTTPRSPRCEARLECHRYRGAGSCR